MTNRSSAHGLARLARLVPQVPRPDDLRGQAQLLEQLHELELLGLTGAAAMEPALERLAKDLPPGARLVVKRGARGAAIFRDGLLQNVPADVLDVIDTVGAGEAFNAGYLSALADGESDLVALARGVRVAGTVIIEFPRGSDPIPSAP